MTRNYARRYAKEFNFFRMLYQILWCVFVAIPIFWFFYKFEVKGRENIPNKGKFICAAEQS